MVVSLKRDLIDATRAARDVCGETRVFDPSGVSGMASVGLARWSPLRAAASPRGAQKAAAALAAAIPRSGVDGGADYWVKQAEILLTGLLGTAALVPGRTMLDVAHWVFTKDIPVKKRMNDITRILRDVKAAGNPAACEAAAAAMLQLDAVWNLDERVRSSVYATVQTVVQAWLDPAVDVSATLEDPTRQRFVDLDWLTDPARSNTLYLVAPLDDQKRLAPVLAKCRLFHLMHVRGCIRIGRLTCMFTSVGGLVVDGSTPSQVCRAENLAVHSADSPPPTTTAPKCDVVTPALPPGRAGRGADRRCRWGCRRRRSPPDPRRTRS